jgi:catechol 2,3-dioxygenase-like lactoylglutathione lyase family enzyme
MLHIEIAVRDAEASCALLERVFGARQVEKEFAGFLDSPFMRIIHVLLGDVVLQLCQPLMEAGSWYDQIQASGPGVHNITFTVENVRETADAMVKLGVEPLFVFPLDWGTLFGDEAAGADVPPVHMMNSMEKLGFHLELGEKLPDMELPFLYRPI